MGSYSCNREGIRGSYPSHIMKNSTKCCINRIITCLSPVRAEGGWCWKEYATAGLVGGVAAVVGAPHVLSVTGFTATGVAAGSIAAGIQSAVYGGAVASGSIFAGLQSAGAAGMGAKATMALFSSGAAVTTYIKNKVAP